MTNQPTGQAREVKNAHPTQHPAGLSARSGGEDTNMNEIQTYNDPMALYAQALDKGLDPEKLDKLLDVADRWEAKNARRDFADAMMKAQQEMPVVVKDKTNTHTKSGYASYENVHRTIKGVYLRHGFTVSFGEVDCDQEGWIKIHAQVRHSGGHAEDYYQSGPVDDKGPKGNAVKTGLHGSQSTRTYLQRTLLCSIFSVTIADQDTDGNQPFKPITAEQERELDQMCEAFGDDYETGRRMKAFYGIESLGELSADQFARVKAQLEQRLEESKQTAGAA